LPSCPLAGGCGVSLLTALELLPGLSQVVAVSAWAVSPGPAVELISNYAG
jgi:hypothetical protein